VFYGEDVGQIVSYPPKADVRYIKAGVACVILFIVGKLVVIGLVVVLVWPDAIMTHRQDLDGLIDLGLVLNVGCRR